MGSDRIKEIVFNKQIKNLLDKCYSRSLTFLNYSNCTQLGVDILFKPTDRQTVYNRSHNEEINK